MLYRTLTNANSASSTGLRTELDLTQRHNGELEGQIEIAEYKTQMEDRGATERRGERRYVAT